MSGAEPTVFWMIFGIIGIVAVSWLAVLGLVALALEVRKLLSSSWDRYEGQHVVISGASEGLGREMVKDLLGAGARVTLISRNMDKLTKAVDYAVENCGRDRARENAKCFPCDVSDCEKVAIVLQQARQNFGPIDLLIPCAGFSATGKALERSLDDHKFSMDVNYFGSLNMVYAALPDMKEQRRGEICLVSSAAGLTSYVGYAAYSPSKYALRGLAESLRNELLPYNITMHIAYPSNMDTPGYAEEMRTKPAETVEMESDGVLHPASAVSSSILSSIARREYSIFCSDFDAGMLGCVTNGILPRNNIAKDILVAPVLIFVAIVFRSGFDRVVMKTYRASQAAATEGKGPVESEHMKTN